MKDLMTEGYLPVDLDKMDEGVRSVEFGEGKELFIRQKDHFNRDEIVMCFKVILPDPVSLNYFYKIARTFPVATIKHGWFIHPFDEVETDDGTKKPYRFFHVSPASLGEPDLVREWLEDCLHDLQGYFGGKPEEVDEKVRIFRSLYTNKNPKHKHIGQPSNDRNKSLVAKIKPDHPGVSESTLSKWVKEVREVWQVFKSKYFMTIVRVSEDLNEEGQSVPLTNEGQILDFSRTLYNAIFGKKDGLLKRNASIKSVEAGKRKGQPFGAHSRFVSFDPTQPTFDIFIESEYNTQFVREGSGDKGYIDFQAWFRQEPSTLEGAEDFWAEDKRIDLLKHIKAGIKDEQFVIDCFRAHFGELTKEEFYKLHPKEEDDDGSKKATASSKAEELAKEAKTNKPEVKEEKETAEEDHSEELAKIKSSLDMLAGMEGVPLPEQLLSRYKELTGKTYGTEAEAEAEATEEAEEPVEDKPKKTTTRKKTTRNRKVADV